MLKDNFKYIIVSAIAAGLGYLMACAGGDGGSQYSSMSVFGLCTLLAFLINWLAYIPAAIKQTEHYYDLTGSFCYLLIIIVAVTLSAPLDLRSSLAALMVIVWALRLGSFLFFRVKQVGKDSRFDQIKINPCRFLTSWTLQGLWVTITAACALVIITTTSRLEMQWHDYLCVLLWVIGFTIEVLADKQKSRFKQDPANQGKFISTGLWSVSRHPNYFGEIVLWAAMAMLAIPVLSGWQWAALISPVFVYLLIRYVSGVTILEKNAHEKWGEQADYKEYLKGTNLLSVWPKAKRK